MPEFVSTRGRSPAESGAAAVLADGEEVRAVRHPVSPDWLFVALIPDFPLRTEDSRKALPDRVPFGDAVFSVSRVSVLLGALRDGDERLLRSSLADRLHEPFRIPLIRDGAALRKRALEHGAAAVFVNGAGPALMAVTKDPRFARRLAGDLGELRRHWRVLPLAADGNGASVLRVR